MNARHFTHICWVRCRIYIVFHADFHPTTKLQTFQTVHQLVPLLFVCIFNTLIKIKLVCSFSPLTFWVENNADDHHCVDAWMNDKQECKNLKKETTQHTLHSVMFVVVVFRSLGCIKQMWKAERTVEKCKNVGVECVQRARTVFDPHGHNNCHSTHNQQPYRTEKQKIKTP